jgi:hypothetical protein
LVLAFDEVTGRYHLPDAANLLIHNGLTLSDLSRIRAQYEITGIVDAHFGYTVKSERYDVRIRAGRNDEIVFEEILVSIKKKVNARVYARILYLRVIREVCLPLSRIAAAEIVRFGDQAFKPG